MIGIASGQARLLFREDFAPPSRPCLALGFAVWSLFGLGVYRFGVWGLGFEVLG